MIIMIIMVLIILAILFNIVPICIWIVHALTAAVMTCPAKQHSDAKKMKHQAKIYDAMIKEHRQNQKEYDEWLKSTKIKK